MEINRWKLRNFRRPPTEGNLISVGCREPTEVSVQPVTSVGSPGRRKLATNFRQLLTPTEITGPTVTSISFSGRRKLSTNFRRLQEPMEITVLTLTSIGLAGRRKLKARPGQSSAQFLYAPGQTFKFIHTISNSSRIHI
jgi:hypothetical protein